MQNYTLARKEMFYAGVETSEELRFDIRLRPLVYMMSTLVFE